MMWYSCHFHSYTVATVDAVHLAICCGDVKPFKHHIECNVIQVSQSYKK